MRSKFMDELMAEPIRLPGCPDVIVTRSVAYHFLLNLGFDPHDKGFGSIDYMVFGRPAVDLPLSDMSWVQPFMDRSVEFEKSRRVA